MNWRTLIVTDTEGDTVGTLGEIMDICPANLDGATITDGKIAAWLGFFIAADGEDPDWHTPTAPVEWDGFAEAWDQASGQERGTAD